MSASKNASKSQYIQFRQEQLGDIERLKSICFPKTPKTISNQSNNNNNNSVLLNSGGKHNYNLNYFSKQPQQQVFFNDNSTSPSQVQKRREKNKSLDHGTAFFGKENEFCNEELSFNELANNSGGFYGSNKKRQMLKNISQNEISNLNNDNLDHQNYPRKKSEKKNHFQNMSNMSNNSYIQNTSKVNDQIQHYDYFEPTTRSIHIDNSNQSALMIAQGSNYNFSRKSSMGDTPIQPSNVMREMVEFIRRIGCELNDLCLTKMSEKTLQNMIELHLSNVGRMQHMFQEALKDKEPNITLALNVLSKCFEELVEKLGDLITRLRMFNKRKFKNLVESSLSNTLKEVFEENNKLNILEIITDINVFVNQQRKNLYFWRLSALMESCKYKNKSNAFFQIIDCARQNQSQQILKQERLKLKLSKVLLIPDQILKQKVQIAFYKWHYCKQLKKQIEGIFFEGSQRLNMIFDKVQRVNKQEGFKLLLQNFKRWQDLKVKLGKFVHLIKNLNSKNKQYALESMKKNKFAFQMNKNETIQKVKVLFLAKLIRNVNLRKYKESFEKIQNFISTRDMKKQALLKIKNLLEKRNKLILAQCFSNLSNNKVQGSRIEKFRAIIISKMIQKLYQTRLHEIFNDIKTELFVRPQPIKLVFKAVHEAIDKIDNPTLRSILRTIDVCFSNKKITRHLNNLRQIQFVLINMCSREIIQLNPIWKKLENQQLENEQIYYINQIINKESSFESGSENLNYPILSTNLSAREKQSVETVLLNLNVDQSKNYLLACETVSDFQMNDSVQHKIIKLCRYIKSRLKESVQKEKLHLNNCRNIRERHLKSNILKYFSLWKQQNYERLITEKDQSSEKVIDLEKQLIQYKIELEKNKVQSTNIMNELGMKREEVIEIETRLEDLTIEKKAKSKCLATALFANYLEKRETRQQQVKKSFIKWIDFVMQKRIAAVACQQIEEINTKHIDTRFSSAFYLLKHFQDSYQRRLKIYTLKYLAYNSVCNNSQLNFSQFNISNANRSNTPTTLSPNTNLSKKKAHNLSQTNIQNDSLKPNNNQQTISELSQNHNQSESTLNIQTMQQPSIQQNSNFETPLPSPLNSNLSQSILQEAKHKPFFSSAGGNKTKQGILINGSNSKKNNPNTFGAQQFGFNRENQSQILFQQQQNIFMKKNDSSSNMQILTEDSTSQPPIQLQPTQITNPMISNTSRTGNNNSSSTSSLINLQLQKPYQYQEYSMTSQKHKPRLNQFHQQQENIFVQQQQIDSRSSNSTNNLNNSFHHFYRPPLHNNQEYLDANQQNINTVNSGSTYRAGLNKSFSNYNTHSNHNTSFSNSKQPSNLGYRLSAKTINFLQKFGRGSSTGENPIQGGNSNLFGNTSSSSASQRVLMMNNSQIHNNYQLRNKSNNPDFQSVSSRHIDQDDSFYKKY
ncbi:hypothetical protein ABPG72_013961 [Tetrahymena utriculariae]